MSNTGYKCITVTTVDGEVERYQVRVQWRGQVLSKWLYNSTLDEALHTREVFEKRLRKPRSERRIVYRPLGFCIDPRDKVHGAPVVRAYVYDSLGQRISKSWSTAKHGVRGARAKAKNWRAHHVRRLYTGVDQYA